MEKPEFILKINEKRATTGKTLQLLFLGLLLYLGIMINAYFLKFKLTSTIHIILTSLLIITLALEILLSHLRFSRLKYSYFLNRIENNGSTIVQLNKINNVYMKQNLIDKLFKTGTIVLDNNLKIRYIDSPDEINAYTFKLSQYARGKFK